MAQGSARLPGSHPCQPQQRTRCCFSSVKSFLRTRTPAIRGFCWVFLLSLRASRVHAVTLETLGGQSLVVFQGGFPWAGFPWGCHRTATSQRGWTCKRTGTIGLCAGVEFNGLEVAFGDVKEKANTRVRQLGDNPLMLLAHGSAAGEAQQSSGEHGGLSPHPFLRRF